MLLISGAVLGALVGRALGGSLWNLARLRFRWPLVVVVALLVKETSLLAPPSLQSVLPFAYLLSLGVLLGWTLWHRDRMPGMWLVAAGMSMNLVVIAVNGAHMPIPAGLAHHGAPAALANRLLRDHVEGQYVLASASTHLNWLGDVIILPSFLGVIYPSAYSAGDLVALAGVFLVPLVAVSPQVLQNRRLLPVDVERIDSLVLVTASLPGFAPDEIAVDARERTLVIRAERQRGPDDGARELARHERYLGNISRTIRLPARVEPDRAEASIRTGVLQVALPVHAPPSRSVPVAADADGQRSVPVAGENADVDEWSAALAEGSRPRPATNGSSPGEAAAAQKVPPGASLLTRASTIPGTYAAPAEPARTTTAMPPPPPAARPASAPAERPAAAQAARPPEAPAAEASNGIPAPAVPQAPPTPASPPAFLETPTASAPEAPLPAAPLRYVNTEPAADSLQDDYPRPSATRPDRTQILPPRS